MACMHTPESTLWSYMKEECMNVHMHVCTHVFMYVYMWMCTCTYMCVLCMYVLAFFIPLVQCGSDAKILHIRTFYEADTKTWCSVVCIACTYKEYSRGKQTCFDFSLVFSHTREYSSVHALIDGASPAQKIFRLLLGGQDGWRYGFLFEWCSATLFGSLCGPIWVALHIKGVAKITTLPGNTDHVEFFRVLSRLSAVLLDCGGSGCSQIRPFWLCTNILRGFCFGWLFGSVDYALCPGLVLLSWLKSTSLPSGCWEVQYPIDATARQADGLCWFYQGERLGANCTPTAWCRCIFRILSFQRSWKFRESWNVEAKVVSLM